MSSMMDAVVVHAPMEFGVERVPIAQTPEGGFLLKVSACGLCGSDLRTLRFGHRKVTFPWIIGHEICGTVAEVGPNYQGVWRPGDLLSVGPLAYCGTCDFCASGQFELCENYREIGQVWHGGLAEYVAIPEACVRLGNIRHVPPGIDPVLATLVEPFSGCINGQEMGWIGMGDTVVVIGAGPIGAIHTMLARKRGADRIIVADIVTERLKLLEAFDPDVIINAAAVDLVDEVMRITNGKGAEVVITANPVPATQVQAVEMARKGGRVLLYGGLPKGNSQPGIDMNLVHYNALYLIGATIFAPRHQIQAIKLIASGRLPLEKLVTRFQLSEFTTGAALALEGKLLKAVYLAD